MRQALAPFRAKRETIALVPTMGALHRGHLALVAAAKKRADRVVVSIFVNPTQFAPTEDFGSYPRQFEADIKALTEANVDAVWAPTAQAMYPEGFATRVTPEGAALAGLEDKFRPHFFGGVATVVTKLFTQVQPDVALFGQKDYQQLRVVTQMAKDLDLPLKVVGLPTVREKDGLALSSRNAYLSTMERVGGADALSRAQGLRRGDQTRRRHQVDPQCRLRRNRKRRLRTRLSRSPPRADAGAGRVARGRPDPAAGGGENRQDAADR